MRILSKASVMRRVTLAVKLKSNTEPKRPVSLEVGPLQALSPGAARVGALHCNQ